MTTQFVPAISDEVPWATAHHLRLLYQKLNGVATAVVSLHTASTSTTTTVAETTSGGGGGTVATVGTVNDQAGNTAYTTMPSDSGSIIILNDASPVAVTLGIGISTPWFCWFTNLGAGTATLTPAAGTISYFANPAAASMPLKGGYWACIGFDGASFWAASQLVPGITDITGLSAALALLAPIASPTFTGTVTEPTPAVLTAAVTSTSATAGAATALPATPLGYLEMSVNGTTVKVPYYSV
jgi:hypothetical protein